jgi:hypothetical protein
LIVRLPGGTVIRTGDHPLLTFGFAAAQVAGTAAAGVIAVLVQL